MKPENNPTESHHSMNLPEEIPAVDTTAPDTPDTPDTPNTGGTERSLPESDTSTDESDPEVGPDDALSRMLAIDRPERDVGNKAPFRDMGRDYSLPQIEITVLHIAMAKPTFLPKIARELGEADFWAATNKCIFQGLLQLHNDGKPVSFKTLLEHLNAAWPEDESTWNAILSAILDSTAFFKHLDRCIELLKEAAEIRGGKEYCPHKFSETFCTNLFLARVEKIRCVGAIWYRYANGIWEKVPKDLFRPAAMKVIHPDHQGARRCRDVLDFAESQRQFPDLGFQGAYKYDIQGNILVNAANCVIQITTEGEITRQEHSPDFDFTLKLAANFDPAAKCDLFRSKLEESLPDPEDRKLFQAFCGYILEPSCKWEASLVGYGPGGTGKSTQAMAIADVLGPDLVSSVGLEDLSKSGSYALPGLKMKMLNLGSELSGTAAVESANFKKLVSGEPMNVRQIYGAPEEMRTSCKLMFLTNNPPRFHSGTDAEARRLRILHFDRKPVAVDVNLKKKLSQEASGILNWMLEGLKHVLLTGTIPSGGEASKLVLDGFSKSNDPIGSFVKERCSLDPKAKLVKRLLFEEFSEWCEDNGFPAHKWENFFWKTLFQRHPELSHSRNMIDGVRAHCVIGITLLTPREESKGLFSPVPIPANKRNNSRPSKDWIEKLKSRAALAARNHP